MRFRPPTLASFEDVRVRESGRLPHWDLDGGYYFVTMRLADSLPPEAIEALRREQRTLLRTIARDTDHPSLAERDEVARRFHKRLDAYLDAGMGACLLRDDVVAGMVAGAFRFFDGARYSLLAWTVMPNHAHVLARLLGDNRLARVTHSWKSFTAHEANRILEREGAFWQVESFDRLIRTEEELENVKRYIGENPAKAGLRDWKWVWVCG